jgi:hypothetical protein
MIKDGGINLTKYYISSIIDIWIKHMNIYWKLNEKVIHKNGLLLCVY